MRETHRESAIGSMLPRMSTGITCPGLVLESTVWQTPGRPPKNGAEHATRASTIPATSDGNRPHRDLVDGRRVRRDRRPWKCHTRLGGVGTRRIHSSNRWDGNAHRYLGTYRNCDKYSYSDRHEHVHVHRDPDADEHQHGYAHCDPDADGDTYYYSDEHQHHHSDEHQHRHPYRDHYSDADGYQHTLTDRSAEPLRVAACADQAHRAA